MSRLRLAYIALLAASIALRLVFAFPEANAFDRPITDRPGKVLAVQTETQESESGPLITGRSVAASSSSAGEGAGAVERRPHEGVGAAGFARR
jgi:hypothetical protein